MQKTKRGTRNQELLERRNRKLIMRYHQLTEVDRRRFDDVVFILSQNEFFLAEHTINQLLKSNMHLLDELCAGTEIYKPLKPQES